MLSLLRTASALWVIFHALVPFSSADILLNIAVHKNSDGVIPDVYGTVPAGTRLEVSGEDFVGDFNYVTPFFYQLKIHSFEYDLDFKIPVGKCLRSMIRN